VNQLRVTSNPTGADVVLDGQVVGKTPYAGNDLDITVPHALTVRKDGYEPYEQMISGSSGWKKVKAAKGKPAAQTLKINTKLKRLGGGSAPAPAGAAPSPGGEPGAGTEELKPEPPAPSAPVQPPPAGESKPAERTP
jgi:hypothetical protein